MEIITAVGLMKDYGNGKGIFDVSLHVNEGEVFGFLGPNGAGKTTTIRNLMGFIRPDRGNCQINGKDCFEKASEIQKELGYLAGEIAFLDDISGKQLLDFIADMKGMKDKTKMMELMERFELDPRGKVRKMSKGMKQKIGIISAFMNDPKVIILDEPTSGLDPLMQNRFVELVLEEKKKGKTILMSSHIFEEVERTCDRTAIIREGKIVAVEDMESLAQKKKKTYIVTFKNEAEAKRFKQEADKKDTCNDILNSTAGDEAHKNEAELVVMDTKENILTLETKANLNTFFAQLSNYEIKDFDVQKQSLEEIFMHYYGKGGKN